MPEPRVFQFSVNEEVDRYFDESSLSNGAQPKFVLIMGAPCVGKTTFRKQQYPTGHVMIDAAEIFLHLSRDGYYPFPRTFEEPMEWIGRMVANRAISERRHIIIELIGAETEPINALIEAMKAIGYHVNVQFLDCSTEEAVRRNENRENDNISCYFAEPFHRRWLLEAATEAKAQG